MVRLDSCRLIMRIQQTEPTGRSGLSRRRPRRPRTDMSRYAGQHRHVPMPRSKSPAVAARAMATQTSVVDAALLPLHAPVLVLNASYEPINICAARRALVLVLKGVAITEE